MLAAIVTRNTGHGNLRRHSNDSDATRMSPKPSPSGSVATSLNSPKPWLPNWASVNHRTTTMIAPSTSRSRCRCVSVASGINPSVRRVARRRNPPREDPRPPLGGPRRSPRGTFSRAAARPNLAAMRNTRLHTASGGRAGRGLQSLTGWVLAHKRTVAAFWIVLTIAGMFGASRVTDALDDDFTMPSSEAFATNEEIEQRFSSGGPLQPLVAVAELPAGESADDPAVRSDLRRLEGRLAEALPGARIASYGSTGDDAYVSDDGRTTFAIVHPKRDLETEGPGGEIETKTIEAAQGAVDASSVGGADVLLTGRAVLEQAPEGEDGPPSFLNETLIAGVAALAVLVFVFASELAAVPLLMAIVAIPVTLLAVLGLTELTDVSFIVVFLASLIGLGLAIDYALIVVMRWREERERGLSNEDAIGVAVSTAGRAVLFSGTTVAIGLLAAVVLPIPFLRSMAYGGLLIPLVSVAVALTLLPVVLATVGPRADRRRLRRTERAERHWASWAGLVLRGRWPAATAGTALLVVLVAVASSMLLGLPKADSLAESGPARAALDTLERSGIGAAPLAPIQVLTPAEARETTARTLSAVDDVYGAFPLMLTLIALVTFVLLARAFRSLLLPLKAIALNLLSVFAAWGVMTLVWQHGVGAEAVFGTEAPGSIEFWAPIMVFAFLYGLSMDYEVFILARMREEYEKIGSTTEAVVRGLARTGRLVTSAALIVFLAFASMATAAPVEVKIVATGLAAGILLDATIVRTLLVPALVSLFGRWNWWLPDPLRRLLRLPTEPTRAAPHPTATPT